MTCVVFDGKTIAADGKACDGNTVVKLNVKKLVVINGLCIGYCGAARSCKMFMDWWADRTKPYPEVDSFDAMVVDASGKVVSYSGGHPVELDEVVPFCLGSGRDIARGALAAGADSRRAVEIACELDVDCGGEIQVVTLDSLRGHEANKLYRKNGIDRGQHLNAISFPTITAIERRMNND